MVKGPIPLPTEKGALHDPGISTREQGCARSVRAQDSQADTRYCESNRQDSRCIDEARSRCRCGCPDQAELNAGQERMSIGLVGRKAGMTRLFTDTGESVPVTVVVVETEPRNLSQDTRERWLSRHTVDRRNEEAESSVEAASRALGEKRCRSGRGIMGVSPRRRRRGWTGSWSHP